MHRTLLLLFLASCGPEHVPFTGPYRIDGTVVSDTCYEPATVGDKFTSVWTVAEVQAAQLSEYFIFQVEASEWVLYSTDGENFGSSYTRTVAAFPQCAYVSDYEGNFKFGTSKNKRKQTFGGFLKWSVSWVEDPSGFVCGDPCDLTWAIVGKRDIEF